jgi:hypothetical protein
VKPATAYALDLGTTAASTAIGRSCALASKGSGRMLPDVAEERRSILAPDGAAG